MRTPAFLKKSGTPLKERGDGCDPDDESSGLYRKKTANSMADLLSD
jgi:hypothetical protein